MSIQFIETVISGKRSGTFKDLSGMKFGKLAVVKLFGKDRHGNMVWECLCECGKSKVIKRGSLLNGRSQSCGCSRGRYGMRSRMRIYRIWAGMLNRCYNKNNNLYGNYGGRGILVCDEWHGKHGFVRFVTDMGERPSERHSIDRIDNDGHYSPTNCRWATVSEQARNRRSTVWLTLNGETKTLPEWAELVKISRGTLTKRLQYGWTEEEVLTTPLMHDGRCKKDKHASDPHFNR